jgi:uncharacterized protein YgfB (UPF0149 family)
MHAPVAFDDVAQELGLRASTVHPSEAHGCLCGALCARRDYSRGEWLDEIVPEDAEAAGSGAIAALFEETVGVLAGPDLAFQPLLPDDETALEQRVEALAAWCTGFLYGFGATGRADGWRPLPPDVTEVLADFANIAQAGAPGPDAVEEDENDYVQLVEFLRAAVQLVYEAPGAADPARRAPIPAD